MRSLCALRAPDHRGSNSLGCWLPMSLPVQARRSMCKRRCSKQGRRLASR